MKRILFEKLQQWKNSDTRKPLVLRGARQVGKTWLMKEFAKTEYENFIYINFEFDEGMKTLFDADLDPERILLQLKTFSGIEAKPHTTLIIFDEIQETNRGLTALKYFCENAPEYHIVAAGSLLGITLHQNVSFPVGKVDFLDLHPLNFYEFLCAIGQERFAELLKTNDFQMVTSFKTKYIEWLRQYYYVGGMPAAVVSYAEKQDFAEVRTVQKNILDAYESDFSKHAPTEIVPRIRLVWNSILPQLAKENRKFIYSKIQKGARAREFELAMAWLLDCGLIKQVFRVSKPDLPLKAYLDFSAFKIFMVDVGLMSAMAGLDVKTLLQGSKIFEEFKGSLTEQFVFQQLTKKENLVIAYWASESLKAEVDLLIQYSNEIIPVEVKAAENLQAKSLKTYCKKYNPKTAIRTSLSDYREESWLTNVPLYVIGEYF
ncbi:MAG: ATP-binding protein [Flavobacteriaceae bacterium]|jgi:predicted AAA+ superfamily ATPase|nr:ATP-binding protein [Flavobacteriaceae bacterium]